MRFSKKCGQPLILGIFDHFGSNFGQKRPKMTNFIWLIQIFTLHLDKMNKKYICQKCEKSFNQSAGLSRHEKPTHSIEKFEEHECGTCKKKFNRLGNYKVHIKTCKVKDYIGTVYSKECRNTWVLQWFYRREQVQSARGNNLIAYAESDVTDDYGITILQEHYYFNGRYLLKEQSLKAGDLYKIYTSVTFLYK